MIPTPCVPTLKDLTSAAVLEVMREMVRIAQVKWIYCYMYILIGIKVGHFSQLVSCRLKMRTHFNHFLIYRADADAHGKIITVNAL